MDPLAAILTESYGLVDPHLERVLRGHTNETWFVRDGARRLVLRRSWPGKSGSQVAREESVLFGLAALAPHLPVPRVVPTVAGAPHASDGDRTIHLFERLPGAVAEPRSGALGAALAQLASLHRGLALLPSPGRCDPIEWLRERRDRVRERGPLGLPPDVAAELPRLWPTVEAVFAAATQVATGPIQWLHGDVHLGNLLFDGDRVRGIVDFDGVGRGAPSIEVALALFALSRDDRVEDCFRYDRAAWLDALSRYDGPRPELEVTHERLFCVDQVLIHLEASQRRLWSLGPGIGFRPCWRSLLGNDQGRQPSH